MQVMVGPCLTDCDLRLSDVKAFFSIFRPQDSHACEPAVADVKADAALGAVVVCSVDDWCLFGPPAYLPVNERQQ